MNLLVLDQGITDLLIIKQNPHLIVSVLLFGGGGLALWSNVAPLAGSLFGAGGALLGTWVTEFNKRRTDSEEKAKKQTDASAALAPELMRTIERAQYILDRATVNFVSESCADGAFPNDQQADFRPYLPTLYPNTPLMRDLSGDKAIALIRYYDSLNELSNYVNDWWQREGQLAVNVFNGIMHAAEKSIRLGMICVQRFDLEGSFQPPYESWGPLTARLERSLDNAAKSRELHVERSQKSQGATRHRTY
ncbi:hypothetical protein RCF34_22300 [Pseudomonas sp. 102515]|uniref:hypothetical protein n=1 Tax=Pseudomonas sp. 102515 TaxID=3071568 RepID=UPI0028029ED6|nr:hypothetical protein [Pseudomonas sp. 102515]MDQ7915844.1 hypothetical protein [Pseudomonas sp. 102515]